jgi:hypothetical protein
MSPSVETGTCPADFSQSRREKSRPEPLHADYDFFTEPGKEWVDETAMLAQIRGSPGMVGRLDGNPFVPPRVRLCFFAACVPLLAAVAGCSSVSMPSLPAMPTAEDMLPLAPKFELKTLPTSPVRQLGPPALVGPDGSCSAGSGQSEFTGTGIALEMSECDVVQRAGTPVNIQIGANQRGERTAVLTYGGDRPGLYRFVSGRLVSIERVGEPEPEKPAKKKPSKKSATATSSTQ